ncbi:carbohydrate binding domain-containing protein [Flammeovirga sp. SJP92]|uniref:carbohydrate binding domain-containing protein n=1 Tax=Flammeovirga sp. SJP92 TaxID=1775430 RepID=UPI000788D75A|nr:carbohydrate binding domain-containing protein [Flammeovirga sp. SJP92]KXX67799.1 hypothetical protein AVL50_25390 [Flammeovirga sp. SJP92]
MTCSVVFSQAPCLEDAIVSLKVDSNSNLISGRESVITVYDDESKIEKGLSDIEWEVRHFDSSAPDLIIRGGETNEITVKWGDSGDYLISFVAQYKSGNCSKSYQISSQLMLTIKPNIIEFNYPVYSNGSYGEYCEFEKDNHFSVKSSIECLASSSITLKRELEDRSFQDIAKDDPANQYAYYTNDLSKFRIKHSGTYKLENIYTSSCRDIEGGDESIKFYVNVSKPDPDKGIFDYPIDDGMDYAVRCSFTGIRDFVQNNMNYAVTDPTISLQIYDKKDYNGNDIYRNLRPDEGSITGDATDFSFELFAAGKYRIYHEYYVCGDKITKSVVFYLLLIQPPVGVNQLMICEDNDEMSDVLKSFCENPEFGMDGNTRPSTSNGAAMLQYRQSCSDQDFITMPSVGYNNMKFLDISFGDKLDFRMIKDPHKGSLWYKKSTYYIRIYKLNEGKREEIKGITSRRKGQIDLTVDLTDDDFKSGGIFEIEAFVLLKSTRISSKGAPRTARGYFSIKTANSPILGDNPVQRYAQKHPDDNTQDDIHINFGFKNQEDGVKVRAYVWDFEPTYDNLNKNVDYSPRHLKQLQEDNSEKFFFFDQGVTLNSERDRLYGEKWIDLRNVITVVDRNREEHEVESVPLKVISPINVFVKPPLLNEEYDNIVTIKPAESIKKEEIFNNEGLRGYEVWRPVLADGTLVRDEEGELIEYTDTSVGVLEDKNNTAKRYLVYRKIDKEITETPEDLYSFPNKVIIVPKPEIAKDPICPTKFYFNNKNNVTLADVKQSYVWKILHEGTEVTSSTKGSFSYDFLTHLEGDTKDYAVNLSVAYTDPEDKFFTKHRLPVYSDGKGDYPHSRIFKSHTFQAEEVTFTAPYQFKLDEKKIELTREIIKEGYGISAGTFSNAWLISPSDLPVSELSQESLLGMSPWLSGQAGVWRAEKQMAFLAEKSHTAWNSDVNIKNDGLMDLIDFNWKTNGYLINKSSETYSNGKWVRASTITAYNKRGNASEQQDALGNYSSVAFTHDGQFVKATGSNMRKDEMFYSGFEVDDVEKDLFFKNRKLQKLKVVSAKGRLAIVDVQQLEDLDILQDDQTLIMVKGNAYDSDLPAPFTLKGVVSCRFDYNYTPSFDHNTPGGVDAGTGDGKIKYFLIGIEGFGFDNLGEWVGELVVLNQGEESIADNTSNFTINTTEAHSGNHSVAIPSGTQTLTLQHLSLENGKKYVLSGWVKKDESTSFEIAVGDNNAMTPSGNVIEGWQRVHETFTYTDTSKDPLIVQFKSQGSVYLDDLRIYPESGNMQSFVYDPTSYKLKVILDENNFATFYSYDEQQQLQLIRKETEQGIVTLQEVMMNYKDNF